MKDIFFTITGTKYRYGHDFMKPGMKVKLVKEPDNPYDREAIRVEMKNGKKAKGTVKVVLPDGVICRLDK